jgi:hypothetical protein
MRASLEEFIGFARNRRWQAREVLDLIDDFEALRSSRK